MTRPLFDMSQADDAALALLRRAAEAAEAAGAEIAVLHEQVRAVRDLANQNHRLLQGNGEEGIKGRLSHVERTARELRATFDDFVSEDGERWNVLREKRRDGVRLRWRFWKDIVVGLLALTGTVLAVVLN